MLPLSEARAHVLQRLPDLGTEWVRGADATGRVTAEAVVAEAPVPSFDNSAMDGFAVRAADTTGASVAEPVRLTVVGTVAAGDDPVAEVVGPGQAVRIMTGAVMPPGADGVVMIERTALSADGRQVDVAGEIVGGQFVRRAGEDVAAGAEVVAMGRVVRPADVGVLAEIGAAPLLVRRRPQVGVLSTGDELVDDGRPLKRGQIRESNRPMLLAMVAEAGAEAVDLGWAPDDEEAIGALVLRGTEVCDAVISSGGVSMGDFDYVKVVLDRLGDMRWMQIAIKPAKPFAFGVVQGTPVFGLPGNPVSSLVSFELLARPALRQMAGQPMIDRPTVSALIPDGLGRSRDGKVHFLRVDVRWDGSRFVAHGLSRQGSHQLSATAAANGLAVLADGPGVEPGGVAPVLLLDMASAFDLVGDLDQALGS